MILKTVKKSRPLQSCIASCDERTVVPETMFAGMLRQVLSRYFTNGFRIHSSIELSSFRRRLIEDFDDKNLLSDEELIASITVSGTLFGNKIYIVPMHAKERIKEITEKYFESGARIIFYEEFYEKNRDWLFNNNVVSAKMLKDILMELFPQLIFKKDYFGHLNVKTYIALKNEIIRIWEDDVLLTYKQIADRLVYVPIAKIKQFLSQHSDFIWNNIETFSHINKVSITDEECAEIREKVRRGCSAHRYISIVDLPLDQIAERNYELSITAIHNAVYRICLSGDYDKRGKIIFRNGDNIDALSIMKEYCSTIDRCTLSDLLGFEKDLTGEIHRWIPMEAGYAVLVRIDKNIFIAEKHVSFDVAEIDKAIDKFVADDYLPLTSFTSFMTFPYCGKSWNLFLLESYCRRFSKSFKFDTLSVNSRNVGAVVRKSCALNYIEIMADAVAMSGIQLEECSVGRFLYEKGYIGKSTNPKISETIKKAVLLRERRD